MRDCPSQCQDTISTTTTTTTYLTRDQTTPLLQVATYRKNHNLFHYFVLTGVSAVSSESTSSRKCSLSRDFFSQSKSCRGPPTIKIERSPSEDSVFSPVSSPLGPPLSPSESSSSRSPSTRSPRSPTSPTTDSERVYSNRGSSRLSVSTPLSPIKESRKETESLLEWSNSPIKENKLQLAAVPRKQSSRIRCLTSQHLINCIPTFFKCLGVQRKY